MQARLYFCAVLLALGATACVQSARDPIEYFFPDEEDEPEEEEGGGRTSRLFRLGKRLFDRKELADDAMSIVGSVLETSDAAKTVAVKAIAREVRHYLEELKWKDDLKDLLTSNTLRVSAEFTLVPIPKESETDDSPKEDS